MDNNRPSRKGVNDGNDGCYCHAMSCNECLAGSLYTREMTAEYAYESIGDFISYYTPKL